MKTPTPVDVQLFFAHVYDPQKAHEYYIKTRELKGRGRFGADTPPKAKSSTPRFGSDPRAGKSIKEIHTDARAKQRKELTQAIHNLEASLAKLKVAIRKKAAEEDSAARKTKGKKERAVKEKTKPQSAAEKAKVARDNKQYQAKNQQKLKTQSKARSASGGGSAKSSTKNSKPHKGSGKTVDDLVSLAVRVEGKIAVAKQKLAAL